GMKRFLVIIVILLSLVLTACSGSTASTVEAQPSTVEKSGSQQPSSLERKDTQGAVVVTVTPVNLDNPGETLDFNVSMETHSVELDMDLTSLATLSTDTGVSVQSSTWNGPKGGHHIAGTLSFPTQKDGSSLVEGAKVLTLKIQNVDAPERVFSWEIQK
ncbi:MAG TPA: hypothetical protein VHP14_18620, partial [Anaerolineales bacterium]|nr:hypothetical protein [Anaerolineales bacterium]